MTATVRETKQTETAAAAATASGGRGAAADRYAVILVRGEIDRFGHNAVFAREIGEALAAAGGPPARVIDYQARPREVMAALRDPASRFFLCFNGFGAELRLPTGAPGGLLPAWEAFGKPLFDLMHDCPAHESMAHQLGVRTPRREMLVTDWGYAAVARSLGFPRVRFAPSITFPATLGGAPGGVTTALRDRPIEILLPVTIVPAALVTGRLKAQGEGYRARLHRDLFEGVTARAAADLRLDPVAELDAACREAGVTLDHADDPEARRLLSAVLDQVKFERRRRLLRAVARLPVTVISDRPIDEPLPGSATLRIAESRGFAELLATMAGSRCVLAPLPHMTGFHERALGAFTAGAAVVAAPNLLLETCFAQRREIAFYRSPEDAADLLADLLREPDALQAMADRGRDRAMRDYAPARLAETILTIAAGLA